MIIAIPLIIWVVTQSIKFYTRNRAAGRLIWKNFIGDGGMPSSHAAIVSSITTVAGISASWASLSFGICLIFSLIVINDALHLRAVVEDHSRLLNRLRQSLDAADQKRYPATNESVGHKTSEVAAGLALGIVGTLLLYYLFI